MDVRWRYNRLKLRIAMIFAVVFIFDHNISLCWSLNSEGTTFLLINIFLHWFLVKFFFFVFSNFEEVSWWELNAGVALLRFRERVVVDPFGALSSWNDEKGGESESDPCSWFGVECSDGKVVILWVILTVLNF